ncbi:MAG TPA: cytochrome c maturation protein CcmE [Candidatus Binataceae bacterium]|nr:cytochrome c maturation protein CcmE [Candidatus Binataceae bacterium]
MRVKPRFLLGGGLIVAAIGYLIVVGIRSTSEYYLTVPEAQARQAQLMGQAVRVAGRVQAGTISWDPVSLTLRFAMGPIPANDDGTASAAGAIKAVSVHAPLLFAVVCRGEPKPDMFAPGRDVIVEGHLTGPGAIDAEQVLTSCPSKYTPKKPS